MKTLIHLAAILLLPVFVHAQGTVSFANNAVTTIQNSLTGASVTSSQGIKAALYYAPTGPTNFGSFIQIGAAVTVGIPVAGTFSGGNRTTPNTTAPGGFALFQVRAWEASYGATFEEAVSAPAQNGRLALAGFSNVVLIETGNPPVKPPSSSLPSAGLQSFSVEPAALFPRLTINNVVVAEGTNGNVTALFLVSFGVPSEDVVTVDYATSDGTAVAGQDYVSTSGTLTFQPGETSKEINVTVTGDVPVESEEVFHLNLSNPANAMILKAQGNCTITEIRITGLRVDTLVSFNTVAGRHYVLERSQDFVSWTTVTGGADVLGNGGTVMVVDPGSGCDSSRYYRARLIE